MPILEYKCTGGHSVSEYRSFDDNERMTKCPECGEPVIRQFGLTGITFKGSGWGKDR